ncbi:hypothetical protein F2Q70_00023287 [Brassica cretica]|uniref:Uncharacterized protein n=1 Tax=Brassica cretica TaxID=69181 RepID=A0A8S9GM52_BRACR|nr:hypothetical protein F2Q70_00023287 [Brassica cretica]
MISKMSASWLCEVVEEYGVTVGRRWKVIEGKEEETEEMISNADGENSKRDSKNLREVTGESESEEEEEEEANKKRVRERERERRGNIEWMEEKS